MFADAWNVDKGRNCNLCCDITDFRVDLLGPPRGPWNKSAAQVFSKDFIRHHGLESTISVREDVENAFYTRVKTLKEKYKRQQLRPSQVHQEVREDRRRGRKTQVFVTHSSAACNSPKSSFTAIPEAIRCCADAPKPATARSSPAAAGGGGHVQ